MYSTVISAPLPTSGRSYSPVLLSVESGKILAGSSKIIPPVRRLVVATSERADHHSAHGCTLAIPIRPGEHLRTGAVRRRCLRVAKNTSHASGLIRGPCGLGSSVGEWRLQR